MRVEIGGPKPPRIGTAKPSRNAQGSAKSDGEMSEVSTDPGTLRGRIERARRGVRAPHEIFDVVVNPIANTADAVVSGLHVAEGDSRHSYKLIGFAIAARIEKRDHMGGQIGQRGFPYQFGFVKHGHQLDLGFIANDHSSGIRSEAVKSRR